MENYQHQKQVAKFFSGIIIGVLFMGIFLANHASIAQETQDDRAHLPRHYKEMTSAGDYWWAIGSDEKERSIIDILDASGEKVDTLSETLLGRTRTAVAKRFNPERSLSFLYEKILYLGENTVAVFINKNKKNNITTEVSFYTTDGRELDSNYSSTFKKYQHDILSTVKPNNLRSAIIFDDAQWLLYNNGILKLSENGLEIINNAPQLLVEWAIFDDTLWSHNTVSLFKFGSEMTQAPAKYCISKEKSGKFNLQLKCQERILIEGMVTGNNGELLVLVRDNDSHILLSLDNTAAFLSLERTDPFLSLDNLLALDTVREPIENTDSDDKVAGFRIVKNDFINKRFTKGLWKIGETIIIGILDLNEPTTFYYIDDIN